MKMKPLVLAFSLILSSQSIFGQGVAVGTRVDLTQRLQLGAGQFAQVFIPDYFIEPANGEFTLVFHLHSASWAAEDEVYRAGLNAVLFNIHLGGFSSAYQNYFVNQSRFQQIMDTVLSVLDAGNIVSNPVIDRFILTSFSAGYAGVREMFKTPAYYNSIDALTLADGLHCSSDPGTRQIQMQDFVRFAGDARDGHKVFLLTHSSITTSGYDNTTQTADYLISNIGAVRVPFNNIDPIGTQYSRADTGFFHVRGYFGTTAGDHLQHLYNMHVMLRAADSLIQLQTVGVESEKPKPEGFHLYRNYPNPFNPSTTIPFEVASRSYVNLSVFDMEGRKVGTLVDGFTSPGLHMAHWNGRNDLGVPVSSGTYIARMEAGMHVGTTKVILLR